MDTKKAMLILNDIVEKISTHSLTQCTDALAAYDELQELVKYEFDTLPLELQKIATLVILGELIETFPQLRDLPESNAAADVHDSLSANYSFRYMNEDEKSLYDLHDYPSVKVYYRNSDQTPEKSPEEKANDLLDRVFKDN